jgi:hypothetical protein
MKYIFERNEPLALKASYCEIYNDDIIDLLNLRNKHLFIRDNNCKISGLSEMTICDYEDCVK